MDLLIAFVVIGVIVWFVLRAKRPGSSSGILQTKTALRSRTTGTPHQLPGDPTLLGSRGRVSVVGESHYQSAIAAVVAGRYVADGGTWDEALEAKAALIPEPSNPYDSNAVRIDLSTGNGWVTVGYLSRDIAPDYQPTMRSMTQDGRLPCAPARICKATAGPLAVYLHLSDPEGLVFRNSLSGSATVLPARKSCAISGEDHHQEWLERFHPQPDESVPVWATLHPGQIKSGKYAGMPSFEVRLDGERVGELTASQADRYTGVLSASDLACEAEIYCGAKKIEMRIFLPTA